MSLFTIHQAERTNCLVILSLEGFLVKFILFEIVILKKLLSDAEMVCIHVYSSNVSHLFHFTENIMKNISILPPKAI